MRGLVAVTIMGLLLAACDRGALVVKERQRDDALYAKWRANPQNFEELTALQTYLNAKGVGDIIPVRQLVRSDVNWERCNAPPFLVPPRRQWAHLVPTLRLLKEDVIPRMGRVEALSVYRSADINACLHGAPQSSHMAFHAIDMRFVSERPRAQMIADLCALHRSIGSKRQMGLGIYKGDRFHIDTNGYRMWGHDQRGATSPCHHIGQQ